MKHISKMAINMNQILSKSKLFKRTQFNLEMVPQFGNILKNEVKIVSVLN